MYTNDLKANVDILLKASRDLTLQEQKIVLLLASVIQPSDGVDKEYTFKVKDILDTLDIEDFDNYKKLAIITKQLIGKSITIEDGNIKTHLAWLSSVIYNIEEDTVRIKIVPSLKPYMLLLKKLCVSCKISDIIEMNNASFV